jgi:hypothetical protein
MILGRIRQADMFADLDRDHVIDGVATSMGLRAL